MQSLEGHLPQTPWTVLHPSCSTVNRREYVTPVVLFKPEHVSGMDEDGTYQSVGPGPQSLNPQRCSEPTSTVTLA